MDPALNNLRESFTTKMELLVDKLHEILETRDSQWEDQESKIKELVKNHLEDTLLDELHPEVKSRALLQITKLGDLALTKGPSSIKNCSKTMQTFSGYLGKTWEKGS